MSDRSITDLARDAREALESLRSSLSDLKQKIAESEQHAAELRRSLKAANELLAGSAETQRYD
jgi:hypothetical protein